MKDVFVQHVQCPIEHWRHTISLCKWMCAISLKITHEKRSGAVVKFSRACRSLALDISFHYLSKSRYSYYFTGILAVPKTASITRSNNCRQRMSNISCQETARIDVQNFCDIRRKDQNPCKDARTPKPKSFISKLPNFEKVSSFAWHITVANHNTWHRIVNTFESSSCVFRKFVIFTQLLAS